MKGIKHIIPALSAVLLAVILLAGCSESDWDKITVSSDVKVAETQNHTLSESEMRVLEYQCFNEAYSNLYYTCLYQSYGLSSLSSDDYVFPDIASYTGSPESYVAAHIDSLDIEGMAYERAETLLVYNESADREGYHADAERLAMVKENVPYINIDTLRNAAEHADKSLSAYIRFAIGNGVSESDVENVLDLYARCSLFAENKAESLQEAESAEEAEKYREDNKSQFYYSEYVSCELPNEDWVTEEVREKAAACKTF